jgi:hypothetical protein
MDFLWIERDLARKQASELDTFSYFTPNHVLSVLLYATWKSYRTIICFFSKSHSHLRVAPPLGLDTEQALS